MAASGKGISLRVGGGGRKASNFSAEEDISDELAHRKAEEAASRRFQAAEWLRQMDRGALESLSEEPSEEEFCLALRNGLILCNVLNRVNPGAISKVVENPVITVQSTDGGAQSAIQYFENMRNFLVAVGEMKLLTFEASDLEKGGSSIKVVDCILCIKGYHEWKLAGGIGIWRYGGMVKIISSSKGLPSSLLGGAIADDSDDNCTFLYNQQLLEVLHLFTETFLEESETTSSLGYLYDQFGVRLLHAFLTKWCGSEDFPLNATLIDVVLEKAVKVFYTLLVSQRNQLGVLLKKSMKDDGRNISKMEFVEAVSRYLIEIRRDPSMCSKLCLHGRFSNANSEDKLDNQEKQLEKLKLSFQEMKVQVECSQRKWEEEVKKLEHHIQDYKVNTSSYYKLLEENRLLYNLVQDLKGNIRVYCRVRPFLTTPYDGKSIIDHIGESGNIMIVNPRKQGKDARKTFSFNRVFGANATQCEVFADTQPLIRSVMDGYNVCIFAYGQTGSGKTYTMSGPDITTEETWGMNYRALDDLFHISESRTGIIRYDVSVQMIEIYNEQVRDLLVVHGSNKRLDIRNNSQLNGLNIPDACLVSVKCTQDILDLMKIGQENRAVGATALNEHSSRSHSVLTVHIYGKELVSGTVLRGCLHLVDLAGSERVDKSEATGERLKEAQHINRSLSALGDVIFALSQKSSHIPYRNSKLTQVLQDALGGQAKTLMFVHISPEVNSFGETVSSLKFAERVASVELGVARANKETGEIRELKEEISKLKSAMETKESEIVKLKDTCRITLEVQNLRITPPLQLDKHGICVNLKPDGYQRPTGDPRKNESRSCSSGKQRKTRLHPALLHTDIDAKSPFSRGLLHTDIDAKSPFSRGESFINSRKLMSPSPPIRRSVSTDRAAAIKSKPKIQMVDEIPILNLQFADKVSINRSVSAAPSVPRNKGSSECGWFPPELANSRRVFAEHEEQQSKPPFGVRPGGVRRNKAEIAPKSEMDTGAKAEARNKSDLRETENECALADSPLHRSPKANKLQRLATRASQYTEARAFVQPEEPLSTAEHENKPPNSAIRNRKAGSESTESDFRRSRYLTRGKFPL